MGQYYPIVGKWDAELGGSAEQNQKGLRSTDINDNIVRACPRHKNKDIDSAFVQFDFFYFFSIFDLWWTSSIISSLSLSSAPSVDRKRHIKRPAVSFF